MTEVPASAKHLRRVSRVACRARALRGCRCGIIRVTIGVAGTTKKFLDDKKQKKLFRIVVSIRVFASSRHHKRSS
jgi:hypothetical protein